LPLGFLLCALALVVLLVLAASCGAGATATAETGGFVLLEPGALCFVAGAWEFADCAATGEFVAGPLTFATLLEVVAAEGLPAVLLATVCGLPLVLAGVAFWATHAAARAAASAKVFVSFI